MKKKPSEDLDDDLRSHYDFNFSKMKPNRFAGMQLSVPIYLDDDVAEVFDSSEAVNTVLLKAAASRRTPKAFMV